MKKNTESCACLSSQTYTACVVWCGVGHEELMKGIRAHGPPLCGGPCPSSCPLVPGFSSLVRASGLHGAYWSRYHGGRRPSSDYSPTVIPPSALDKPSIMERYHRRRACSYTSPRRSPTMVTLHDTRVCRVPMVK